jgi:hypothetical protein
LKNVADLFSIQMDKGEELFKFSILNHLQIAFKPNYPLDIIFGKDVLTLYNRIFKFILEIKKAKHALIVNK